MMRNIWRGISWPVLLAGLSAPFIIDCGIMSQAKNIASAANIPTGCPDTSSVEEVDKFDFAGTFKLPPEMANKIKASVGAAVELKELADKIDADLLEACGGLAKDLGDPSTYKSGQDACKGALKVIGETKAKLGPNASIKIEIAEPHCAIDAEAYADCAARCDPTIQPGSVDAKCEGGELQGTCTAQCKGDCELDAAAACSGECTGTCDANVSGVCDGTCNGKCDGKATAASGAPCSGKCEGKCSGSVKGVCRGNCAGSCHLSRGGTCSGTCTGSCSAKMQAPKCTGNVSPPKVSADCKAKCDAQVHAKASCTRAHVILKITGAADPEVEAKLRAAVEKNLPLVVSVGTRVGKNVIKLGKDILVMADGVRNIIQTTIADKVVGAVVIACVASPFKGAIEGVVSIEANVNVSVDIQATATANESVKTASATKG